MRGIITLILAVVEDAGSVSLLSADIRHPLFVLAIALIYMVHHAVTIFAFVFILSTSSSSLGVLLALKETLKFSFRFDCRYTHTKTTNTGLAFEATLNRYKVCENSPQRCKYYDENESHKVCSPSIAILNKVQPFCWFLFFVAIFVCRLTPVGLFLLCFWQENLVKLSKLFESQKKNFRWDIHCS